MQPLRQGASLKPDGGNCAVLVADPARQRLGLAGHLRLLHDLPMLADHADRGLLQRHIQPDKQLHPAVLHVDPIREWRQLALNLATVTGGSRRRPRYGISFTCHSQTMTVAARATADRKTFGHLSPRVAARRQSLSLPEDDLDAVSAFAASLVVLAARLAAGDAGPYPLVFQRIPEPVGIMAPLGQQSVRLRQAARQRGCAGVVANLVCGHEFAG
ncbi:hypothetical protein PAAM106076_18700 [Paracoccus aminovorans]